MMEAWIGLGGVIVGSVITITKDVWISWIERRGQGSYSAIRLACILEEYADKCIDVVRDDGTAHGEPAGRYESGEEYYKSQVNPPKPLEFPEDISWQSLPRSLMHRILALPNSARSIDRHVSACSENAFPPGFEEFFETRQEGYAHLGLEAFKIVGDIQKKFGISKNTQANLNVDWDPKTFLSDSLTSLKTRRAKALNTNTNEQ